MAVTETISNASPSRRLLNITPLRYPGGKGKLAGYVKLLIEENGLLGGDYIEPYAGGAGIALELLFTQHVSRIRINDVSRPIYAFWKSVLDHTEELCRLVADTPVTVTIWDEQKKVLAKKSEHDDLALGFAAFFLNRTNRSGILNGGIIGGRDQKGAWKIDARYNQTELVSRIQCIAGMRDKIELSCEDALVFLSNGGRFWPKKSLIYLDPPYYVKGPELYYNYYRHNDHVQMAKAVKKIKRQKWIVSYDNAPEIRALYADSQHITYKIGYSARSRRKGTEIMFFCDHIRPLPLIGPFEQLSYPSTELKGLDGQICIDVAK